jgi:hypothetical protein
MLWVVDRTTTGCKNDMENFSFGKFGQEKEGRASIIHPTLL